MPKLAILIHTFIRDDKMMRCIKSIFNNAGVPFKLYLSDGGIQTPEKTRFYNNLRNKGHEVILFPFDFPPGVARNIMIKRMSEEYILKMDDDFLVGAETKIKEIIYALDNSELDLLSMGVQSHAKRSPFIFNIHHYKDEQAGLCIRLLPEKKWNLEQIGTLKFHRCDVAPDCFIARRSIFPQCNWDSRYHVGEGMHTDFFLHLKQLGKRVAYTDWSTMFHMKHHAQEEDDELYKSLRVRNGGDNSKLLKKWKINKINYW